MQTALYRSLDHNKLLATIRNFRARIDKLFPGSGLGEVGQELEQTAVYCFKEIDEQVKPLWRLRMAVALAVFVLILVPVETLLLQGFELRFTSLAEFVQAADAGFNVLLVIAGGVIFLVNTEKRLKRHRAYDSLHQLRSLAHVIDMHQISKDPRPSLGLSDDRLRTHARPKAIKSQTDLWYYLSFCTDLLAVTGKLAACFAHCQNDRVVLDSINEIEMLTTALSRKIWQKMSLVERPMAASSAADATPEADTELWSGPC